MVKQLHTNSNLFVALDLCQLHYQNLLDIYQKDFIMISPRIVNLNLSFKDDQLIFRCFEWKKNYWKDFNKELTYRFSNTYGFCNGVINKFISLLGKSVSPYEYTNSSKKFEETSLPDRK